MSYIRIIYTCWLLLLFQSGLFAQSEATARNLIFNPALKPFYHGVASGDPTPNSVVLWTRVTPDTSTGPIDVQYTVATDVAFQQIIQTGVLTADATTDYCVKTTITGLNAGTTYFYYFNAENANSLIGRAKTCPAGNVAHLRFAFASCANYESGYFNAYAGIAERNDLDAVVHLGDYIYEYGTGGGISGRITEPANEIITLADYRTRYSLYRLDADLIRLHQQHTVISVWDDHESANDAYTDGAQNHQPDTEGSWAVRKAISKKVYFEWMPVQDNPTAQIYRKIQYGDLCDLLLLDTRLEGRVMPPPHFDTPDSPARNIISTTQFDWLVSNLHHSTARWKVIGNQVLLSTFNIGFAAGVLDGSPDFTNIDSIRQVEDAFIDNWECYPTQRNALIDSIRDQHIENVVVLSGDSHCSWAFDVTKEAVRYPVASAFNIPQPNPYDANTKEGYNPLTRDGTWAVEYGTPSVSSDNFDELVGLARSNQFEGLMNAPVPLLNVNYNPHLKFVDLDRHGYILLDLTPDTAQANFYYVSTLSADTAMEDFGQAAFSTNGQPYVHLRISPSPGKIVQDMPTPVLPFGMTGTRIPAAASQLLGVFPNPAVREIYLHIGVNQSVDLAISIWDLAGRQRILEEQVHFDPGIHYHRVVLPDLPAGACLLRVGDTSSRIIFVK